MLFALPRFQYRFMPAAGNVIFPGNFHPVGAQRGGELMVERALEDRAREVEPGEGGIWLVVGGSGGFGSAARVALGMDCGAHTINLSFDAPPNPESNNKIRKIGSPGFHRNYAIEKKLRALDLTAYSHNADAFDPETITQVVDGLRQQGEGAKLKGIVWALAAPRGLDPRTGKAVSSVLKPLGNTATVKSFGEPADADSGPQISQLEIKPGSPEEAIRTQYVMGGGIVEKWVMALLEAGVVADGFRLLTISYRGNPLNEAIYRKGLIGLAKADLEFQTRALNEVLKNRVNGSAYAVEGPAVVTEASGGIPGVPLYMALIRDVMGDAFEDPLASMRRMFKQHFGPGNEPQLDDEGLLRMDDRELEESIQAEMAKRYETLAVGKELDRSLYEEFMQAYERTRGFGIDGVDYSAEFDSDKLCE